MKLPFFNVKKVKTNPINSKNYYSDINDPVISFSWTGEKTPGELRPTKDYIPDFQRLALKSWQAYYESDIAKAIIDTDVFWTIGSGLMLRAEPVSSIIESSGYEFKGEVRDNFKRLIEDYFKIHCESRQSDYTNNSDFHKNCEMGRRIARVGGDCLHIFRYIDDTLTHQIIDGVNVIDPTCLKPSYLEEATKKGNIIRHGVELNKRGEHVAFYVRYIENNRYNIARVPARGENSGKIISCLEYSSRYRIDDVRGMPLLSTVLETMRKIDRYKDAVLGSAEERQKIAYYAEHSQYSTGESPITDSIRNAEMMGLPGVATETIKSDGYAVPAGLAQKVATTTNKQFFNLPVGAKLGQLESKNETYFKDFFNENFAITCACLNIPPEMVIKRFDSNFSASRMAAKIWEYQTNINRRDTAFYNYIPCYKLFLEIMVRKNKVSLPGYLSAVNSGDYLQIEAYEYARFVGFPVPHVDPVKEVQAERLKIGNNEIPLTSPSDAAERLNLGDYKENIKEYQKEFYEYQEILGTKQPENNEKTEGIDDGTDEEMSE